jgi:hypothetical protein
MIGVFEDVTQGMVGVRTGVMGCNRGVSDGFRMLLIAKPNAVFSELTLVLQWSWLLPLWAFIDWNVIKVGISAVRDPLLPLQSPHFCPPIQAPAEEASTCPVS